MEMSSFTSKQGSAGVALLMSLSIILLLSIALMKTFESKSIEVAHLDNNLQRFEAETLSRSVFRAILLAIKEKGLIPIVRNKNLWSGVQLPLGNGSFQIQAIEPIDHRFNINHEFKLNDPKVYIFFNLVTQYQAKKEEGINIFQKEIFVAASAVNDWIDVDRDPDEQFLYDSERYLDEEPEFEVKNRYFDFLSELKIIPAIRKLGFQTNDFAQIFRVHGGIESFININLATKAEVEDFLERFKDVDDYAKVYDNRVKLAEIIDDQDADNMNNQALFNLVPRFTPPLYDFKSKWKLLLDDAGFGNLSQREEDLFKATTAYLAIRFSVLVGRVTVKVKSIVAVDYIKNSTVIKKFTIHEFSIL